MAAGEHEGSQGVGKAADDSDVADVADVHADAAAAAWTIRDVGMLPTQFRYDSNFALLFDL